MLQRSVIALVVLLLLVSCAPTARTAPPLTHLTPNPSPTPTWTPGAGLSAGPAPPESNPVEETLSPPAPQPSPTPTTPPRTRAVVVIWDAGQAGYVYDLMEAGQLPHFSQAAVQGLRLVSARSIDPSLSAPAQASLVSGVYPNQTGIVSNAYHNPTDSFYWYRQGFDEPFDQAEPVWVTASRHGLKSAALFMVGGSPEFPAQTADYTIAYGRRDAYSKQEQVSLVPSSGWDGAPPSFSPALEGFFFIPQVARVDVLVLDTSDDRLPNYDLVLLNPANSAASRQVSASTLPLESGEWGSLVLLPHLTAGADFLLQEISNQQVTLYYSPVYHNLAAPQALLEALNQKFGFFPAGPDDYALEHGWISADDYREMLESQARWMAQVTTWVYETYQPDLLFTWQNGFDAAGHTFLLVDERQSGFEPQKADLYASYRLRAAQIADRSLKIMLETLDLEDTTFILTADHGIAPVHTTVYLNRLLQKAGLLKLDRRNYVIVDQSKALAVTSGGSAHIYINLQGRQINGIVPAEEYLALQAQIVALLKGQHDPENGQPVFQRLQAYQELASLGLDHPNSGDVFAQAAPGYHLNDWRGGAEIFAPAELLGDHGHPSENPEMQAFFIAAGGDLLPRAEPLPTASLLDLASTLAHLFAFPASPGWVG